MIQRIAHVCMNVADLRKTEAFYCDALQLEKRFRFLKNGTRCGFYVAVGADTFIEFFQKQEQKQDPGSNDNPAIRHLCLETDDIDALIKRLNQKGIKITEKTLGADGSWQAWTTDPDGVPLEFHEYTAESTQKTGEDCCLG